MPTKSNLFLSAILTIGAAVLIGGCTPPPPPRPTYDSGVTDAEPDWEASSPPEYVMPSIDPVGEPAPQQGATEPAPEPPKRELKPMDEPAPAADEEAEVKAADTKVADTEAAASDSAPAKPAAGDRVVTGDWPCWGGDVHRNMVNATTGIAIDFEPAATAEEGKRLLWVAKLGSHDVFRRAGRFPVRLRFGDTRVIAWVIGGVRRQGVRRHQ